MATYSTIKGFNIQSLASDPSAPGVAGATWASGGEINTARTDASGFGNPAATTAVIAGGWTGPSAGRTLNTETYDGTSWTEVNNLTGSPAISSAGSTGTSTAGLYYGGDPTTPGANVDITQEYDGTSWATSGTMNTARRSFSAGGIQTAAFAALGAVDPPFTTAAETYNGSTWTSVNSCNTARRSSAGSGTTTAALAFGGYIGPSISANAESYNGTSWTEVADLNTARNTGTGTHSGTNTSALMIGGDTPPATAVVEHYDGTSWTEVADLSGVRVTQGGGGTSTDAFVAGGAPAPPSANYKNTTEFFSGGSSIAGEGQVWYNTTSTVLKGFGLTLGTGAWASGTVINTARMNAGAAGVSQDSGLLFDGSPAGADSTNITESYDGTTWTEVADTNVPRKLLVGCGTQTAALACGGVAPPPTPVGPNLQECESWNGTSWTEIADLTRGDTPPVSCSYAIGFGSTTSAMFAGGAEGSPGQLQLAEQWNLTSWSEVADLTRGMGYGAGAGTSGDGGLCTAGSDFSPGSYTESNKNQEWNGTSWTETANINTARNGPGQSVQGTTTASVLFGGKESGPPTTVSTKTEKWDGTSWTEVADLATGRYYLVGAGVQGSALAIGGNPPTPASAYNIVEEWTIPSSYTIKTFTAS